MEKKYIVYNQRYLNGSSIGRPYITARNVNLAELNRLKRENSKYLSSRDKDGVSVKIDKIVPVKKKKRTSSGYGFAKRTGSIW